MLAILDCRSEKDEETITRAGRKTGSLRIPLRCQFDLGIRTSMQNIIRFSAESVTLFVLCLLVAPKASAQSLGIFPADQIYLTQTQSPPSINVLQLRRVNGILHTTVLSRQLSFNGDFQTKFDRLEELISEAKDNKGLIEVLQQHKKYFWLHAHPKGTAEKVSHKLIPFVLDVSEDAHKYDQAYAYYYFRQYYSGN